MTLVEAGEVFEYWAENPPAYLMVQAIARMLGWASVPAPEGAPQSLDAIAAAPPPGLAVIRGRETGMPAPLLDPEALRQRNRVRALDRARDHTGLA